MDLGLASTIEEQSSSTQPLEELANKPTKVESATSMVPPQVPIARGGHVAFVPPCLMEIEQPIPILEEIGWAWGRERGGRGQGARQGARQRIVGATIVRAIGEIFTQEKHHLEINGFSKIVD